MKWKQVLATTAVLIWLILPARAGAPKLDAGAAASLLDASSTASLAGNLRALLLEAMPDPLVEDDKHWGGRRLVPDGIKWHGHGLHVHAEVMKTWRNDGRWWKVKATGERLPDTLVVDLRDVRTVAPGQTTFTAFVAFDARVEYDQQDWDRGVRLYSGSVEAKMHVYAVLRCEATTKLEPNGTLLPDAVFRLRVTDANVGYDHFEVDHIAGVGGDLAKLIGDAAKAGVEQWRPSLERRLLEKADAAIVKAGDTKEVRLSVLKLLKAE
jgi:hypothetical protein